MLFKVLSDLTVGGTQTVVLFPKFSVPILKEDVKKK